MQNLDPVCDQETHTARLSTCQTALKFEATSLPANSLRALTSLVTAQQQNPPLVNTCTDDSSPQSSLERYRGG